eukprot:scaffold7380_cov240-Pinguiococcus_pyrenoidosus.AAC.2
MAIWQEATPRSFALSLSLSLPLPPSPRYLVLISVLLVEVGVDVVPLAHDDILHRELLRIGLAVEAHHTTASRHADLRSFTSNKQKDTGINTLAPRHTHHLEGVDVARGVLLLRDRLVDEVLLVGVLLHIEEHLDLLRPGRRVEVHLQGDQVAAGLFADAHVLRDDVAQLHQLGRHGPPVPLLFLALQLELPVQQSAQCGAGAAAKRPYARK